jgi:hypothetical protein
MAKGWVDLQLKLKIKTFWKQREQYVQKPRLEW